MTKIKQKNMIPKKIHEVKENIKQIKIESNWNSTNKSIIKKMTSIITIIVH